MIGFMLLFASAMSLVINYADKKLAPKDDAASEVVQPEERT
jgi:hypothetical protein